MYYTKILIHTHITTRIPLFSLKNSHNDTGLVK